MGPQISDAGVLTTVNLILIAIFAVLTIIGMAWGVRMSRRRKKAQRTEQERMAEESGDETPARTLPQDATPPPPVAPSPPPISDAPAPGSPAAAAPTLDDEPIAAAAAFDASPASEAELLPALAPSPATPAPPAPAPADGSVAQLKGVGLRVAARLAELGVTTVGQIAALSDDEAEALDARLGPFTGRLARDRWIEQARFLAADDRAGFEAVFGRL